MNINAIKKHLFGILIDLIGQEYSYFKMHLGNLSENDIFYLPENSSNGFLSSNIAFKLSSFGKNKKIMSSSYFLATKISELLLLKIVKSNLKKYIKEIRVVKPGFINFYATNNLYLSLATSILNTSKNWGENSTYKGEQILIEFTDPNPFKEFHVGHLMSNCVGESIARLYEFSGAKVVRLCYQGDVGMHVAKTIWAWNKELKNIKEVTDIDKLPLAKKINLLGKWYSTGSKIYMHGSKKILEEIKNINKLIYLKSNKNINTLYEFGKKWSLESFDVIYKKLGTKFDKFYFESATGIIGKKIVLKFLGKVFKKSKKAIIFPGSKFGLHDRVFVNSYGQPTYEAKELGLAIQKNNDFTYSKSIVITGNEINEYFKVLLESISKIKPVIRKKTMHIGHGMLRLPEGKMSSRTGNIITGESLITLVTSKIVEINNKIDYLTAEKLAISAIKFSLLKQSIGKDVVFFINEAVSLESSGGIYIQYTHTRINSLLKKSNILLNNVNITSSVLTKASIPLYEDLLKFPYLVYSACKKHSPNIIAEYLFSLSQKYNNYYTQNRIIGTKNETSGLIITYLIKNTLSAGLKSMGIDPVDNM